MANGLEFLEVLGYNTHFVWLVRLNQWTRSETLYMNQA